MAAATRVAPRRFTCRVSRLARVTHDIRLVRLSPEGAEARAFLPESFRPGQYASIAFADQPARDYSIANDPAEGEIELHVRNKGEGPSLFVWDHLTEGDTAAVHGPLGDAFLRTDHAGPVLAIAGGSGLAPMKAIVEAALSRDNNRPVYLYYGARDEADVYFASHFEALDQKHATFHFHVVLSEPAAATARRTGLVGEVAIADIGCFDRFKAYLAGPPVMVEATIGLLMSHGMADGDIHADAFYSEAEMVRRRALGLA